MTLADLKLERLRRAEDNTKCDPLDTLLLAHHELSKETRPVVKMVLVAQLENQDGSYSIDSFRAGVTRLEEIALMAVHQQTSINKLCVGTSD